MSRRNRATLFDGHKQRIKEILSLKSMQWAEISGVYV